MSASTVTMAPAPGELRPAFAAGCVAFGLAFVLIVAGLVGSTPLPVLFLILGWAVPFLFYAVASDARFHRVPNFLTLPALCAALLVSPWVGGAGGPIEALAGAALGFALLVGPYAIGGMGAGDVKALMALGAWIGPSATLGTAVWALIAGGTFALVWLALRGELGSFLRRWGRTLVATLTLRRIAYEPPPPGSAAARGIPFLAALALGLAAQWSVGPPW
jgi:prepilin peptidase CpaA